jgi:hypothetical protein
MPGADDAPTRVKPLGLRVSAMGVAAAGARWSGLATARRATA